MTENITIPRKIAMQMKETLKTLNVVGYDSMYRLVSTVEYLEGKLTEEPAKEAAPIRRPTSTPTPRCDTVDHEFQPLESVK